MAFVKIIIMAVAVAFNLFYVFLLLTSGKYDEMTAPLDDKEFPVKDVYGAGLKLIDMFHLDFKSKGANDLREKVKILYGDKYAEFYLRILYAQKFSLSMLTLALCLAMSCFASGTDSLMLFGLGLVMTGVVYYYFGTSAASKIKKQSLLYISDFPDAISTIALLVNSGMVLREAWSEVAYSSEKALHLQMRKVVDDMNNGISESDALYSFSLRCATPEIKKFTSFIIQGLEKGNKDLALSLRNQSNELWEMKRQNVLQQGQLASSKLLIPIFIMFIGILVMVMGPIITNLNV